MRHFVVISIFSLLCCIFLACELTVLMTDAQNGDLCQENTNEFGRCDRNQVCDEYTNSCVGAGEHCENASENVNNYGYCLMGHACVMEQCVEAVFKCSDGNSCPDRYSCEEGSCVCGESGPVCRTGSDCCLFDGKGYCVSKVTNVNGTDCTCLEGFANCDGEWEDGCESDLSKDLLNCGACGNKCEDSSCIDGQCIKVCDDGEILCDLNDSKGLQCINSNLLHLEQCGVCADGFGDCNGTLSDGCEKETGQNNDHCGACGNVCPSSAKCIDGKCACPNGETLCVDGTEQTCIALESLHMSGCKQCATGFDNCDGNWANGCETDLKSNDHCNACNNKCDADKFCSAGLCTLSCAVGEKLCKVNDVSSCYKLSSIHMTNCEACEAGYINCDENWANGCENSLAAHHLSACKTCTSGYTNCDGSWTNGCEANFAETNRTACETCKAGYNNCDNNWGNGCEVNLASSQRTDCTTCVDGYGNCDSNWGNGCETNLSLSNRTACTACKSGFSNCDNDWANGCEADLSATHRTSCTNCAAGYLNCDGNWTNGCELNMATMHQTACTSCTSGYGNCDNDWSNGCESNLTGTNRTTCTACTSGYGNCDSNWSNGCESNLSGTHRTGCTSCVSGYSDCDSNWSNGCESNIAGTHRTSCTSCVPGYGNCNGNWSDGCEGALGNDTNCAYCGNTCNSVQDCVRGACRMKCGQSGTYCPNGTTCTKRRAGSNGTLDTCSSPTERPCFCRCTNGSRGACEADSDVGCSSTGHCGTLDVKYIGSGCAQRTGGACPSGLSSGGEYQNGPVTIGCVKDASFSASVGLIHFKRVSYNGNCYTW